MPAHAAAQFKRPKADVTPLVEQPSLRSGTHARVALKVSLPEGLHTQSNTPRDPNLIPTVLTVDAPAGVSVDEIVFPASTDLKQAGADQPLAVFEQTFAIGVQLSLAATVPAGDIVVPAQLRYQACDANLCYAPANAEVQWTLHVVSADAPGGGAPDPLFAGIKFGTGEEALSSVSSRQSSFLNQQLAISHRNRWRSGAPRRVRGAAARPAAIRTARISSASFTTPSRARNRKGCSRDAVRSRSCCSC